MPLAAAFAIIEIAYVFFVSAGRFTHWPTTLSFLDDQAEGFRAGHLHFAIEPAAALLAKANPFDPAWRPLWYWDASLYNGHYYLYWGPVPALLLAGFKTLFRVHAHIGDQYVVFVLASLQALAGLVLIDRVQRRLFPELPAVFVVLAVAVFAFANPTPYNLARGAVYEAAIVGGHAFLIAGLVFAFDALSALGRQRSRLALAGTCWVLAVGCRASIAPAVALLVALTCWLVAPRARRSLAAAGRRAAVARRADRRRRRALADLQQAALRRLAGLRAALPADVDRVRTRPRPTFRRTSGATRSDRARCAARSRTCSRSRTWARGRCPGWLHAAAGYIVYEPVIGWLLAVPWAWLAPATALFGARRLVALRAAAPTRRAPASGWTSRGRRPGWPPRPRSRPPAASWCR